MLQSENQVSQQKVIILRAVVATVIVLLLGRFFQLQIYRYEQYKVKSEANIIRVQSIPAPRGLIYDREGNILVDNHPTYMLTAIPVEIVNRDSIIKKISKYIEIQEELLTRSYEKYYLGRFHPTRLAKDLSISQLSRIAEHKSELPGIYYKLLPERYYPQFINASHVLGYVREVDRNYLETANQNKQYQLGDMIGWRGLEKQYESILRGTDGARYLRVDALGREVQSSIDHEVIKPIPGEDIHISLDSDLQILIRSEMSGKRGAVIVSDPNSGEIFAFGSFPDYPPDLFTGITLDEDWNVYLNNPDKPLVNRITHGLYPPGSTFKPLVMMALLNYDLVDTSKSITCRGSYRLGRRKYDCWKPGGHGIVNLPKAIIESCNVYFYNMIQLIALDNWAEICRDFSLGNPSGIDLPSELSGNIPDINFMNGKYGVKGWTKGQLLNIAIGQGDILVTPMQMVNMINLIATKGKSYKPHLLIGRESPLSTSFEYKDILWDLLHRYMLGVTHDEKGTGKLAQPRLDNVNSYGKTGTAENPHGDPHAWYIGWANLNNSMISVVILVENSGHGGDIAAPIARKIFEFYYTKYFSEELS